MSRLVTPTQGFDIIKAIGEHFGQTHDEVADMLESAEIFIKEDYMTGGPGYCGPVYIILWDGGPGCVTVLTRKRDSHELEVCPLENTGG